MLFRCGKKTLVWLPIITIGVTLSILCLLLFSIVRADHDVSFEETRLIPIVVIVGFLRTAFLFRLFHTNGMVLKCWSLCKRRSLVAKSTSVEQGKTTIFSFIIGVLSVPHYFSGLDARRIRVIDHSSQQEFFVGYVPYLIGLKEDCSKLFNICGVPSNISLVQQEIKESRHDKIAIIIFLLFMVGLIGSVWWITYLQSVAH